MSDDLVRKYGRARRHDSDGGETLIDDGVFKASDAPVPFLDLRLESGDRVGYAYSRLDKVVYERSEGITLRYIGDTVVIRGRNLDTLYQHLLHQELIWVQEASGSGVAGPAPAVVSVTIEAADDRVGPAAG